MRSRIRADSRVSSLSPSRIALGYAVIAILWIAFSDAVVTHLKLDPAVMTIKGAVFVFVTASLLYFTIRRLVQTVQLSQAYLAEAQRLTHTGSWAYNPATGKATYWSEETFRILGLDSRRGGPPDRAALLRLIHPEDREGFSQRVETAIRAKADFAQEYRIVLPDGTVKYLDEIGHPVLDKAGKLLEYIGTLIDITPQKQAEVLLEARVAERTGLLDAVRTITAEIIGELRLPAVLDLITRRAVMLLGGVAGDIYLWEESTQELVPAAWMNEGDYMRTVRVRLGEHLVGRVAAERQGRIINDYQSRHEAIPVVRAQGRVAAALMEPLLYRNQLVGAITVDREAIGGPFTLENQHALQLLAGHAAIAIENARLYEAAQRELAERTRAEAALRELNAVLEQRVQERTAALRQAGAYTRSLLEASLDALVTISPTGQITDLNAATEAVTGLPRAVLIGTDFSGYFTDPTQARAGYEQAFREGAVQDLPLEIRHRDGHVTAVLYNAAVYRDATGTVSGVFAAARDITARKRAEESLRQSEAYLTEAQRLSHTGSWAFEVASNKYVYVSEECARLFELDAQENSRTREAVSRLIHPEDWPRVNEAFEKAIRERVDTTSEFRITLPSGTVKHVHAVRHPVLNEAGEVVKLVGTVIDITDRKRAEEERRESAERFRAIADYTYDWESWVGNDGALLWVNPAVERITGYSVDECMAMPDYPIPIIAEADRETVARQIREAVQGSSRNDFEFRVRHKEGHLAWVAASWQPIYDSRGARLGHRSSIRDIAERKQAEEALRRSEAYLRETQRLAHAGSWVWDPIHRKFLYASDEMLRLYGFDPDEGIPTPDRVLERIHPDDRDKIKHTRTGTGDVEFDYKYMLPDGAPRHFHCIAHPVVGPSGEAHEVLGIAIDITDRKRAEDALRESETRFRTFVDHAADAFFMLDVEQGTIIDMNRRACESLDYSREELLGKTPLAFDMNLDRATLEGLAGRTAAGETVLFDRHWHRRKDGAVFPVEVQISLFWHGGRRFLLKVARDISDRVRAEEQHERLHQLEADLAHINRVSLLGELAASIAHEVNQPLSGVVSNGGACLRWLAGETPNLEEARDAARRIVRDGKRAGEVIARIRALAKRAETPQEKLDLNDTIRDVLVLVGDEAKRQGVNVRMQFADDLSPVSGDRVQVQQVVLNLVMNGIEAMSGVEGRARELVLTTRNLEPDQVQVTVEDAGIGLAPTAMDKLFAPFYTTKPGGMGMGLSICRSILQSHGGRLWATAKDGPGALFHFTLPRYPAGEAHA